MGQVSSGFLSSLANSCVICIMHSENDVAGIDVNMGCPKDYSLKVCNQFVSCSGWHHL